MEKHNDIETSALPEAKNNIRNAWRDQLKEIFTVLGRDLSKETFYLLGFVAVGVIVCNAHVSSENIPKSSCPTSAPGLVATIPQRSDGSWTETYPTHQLTNH